MGGGEGYKMEVIFEILLDLMIEGSFEASSNRKVPKPVRYLCIVFHVLFFSFVIFGLFFMGIFLWNRNIYVSLFIIAASIMMLVSAVYRFWKTYKNK